MGDALIDTDADVAQLQEGDELLASEDETLLIRRNALLVLHLLLSRTDNWRGEVGEVSQCARQREDVQKMSAQS